MMLRKKINFDYLQSTIELVRCYCLLQRKLHILKFCRKEERYFEWSILIERKITQHTLLLLLQNMLMEKVEIFFYFFTREKFVIIFKLL